MNQHSLDHTTKFTVGFTHRLCFTQDVFSIQNPVLWQTMAPWPKDGATKSLSSSYDRLRLLVFIDHGVIRQSPILIDQIEAWVEAHSDRLVLARSVQIVPGGETSKNNRDVFDGVCRAICDANLCRHSFVIVVGGGAVLDVVGFAASIAHRGVRLIRLPTTSLAQADAGIGVKNGINAFGRKNYLGSFSVPWAVINDDRFLTTLSDRDWRCGFSEVVKVALVKDRQLFDQIIAAMPLLTKRNMDAAIPILRQSSLLHLRHVTQGGDPFELGEGRPLDFGHWAAHKLEQMTNYRLRHGEAVAIGIALDVVYSWLMGLLPQKQAEAVLDCLRQLGFTLHDSELANVSDLLDGVDEFREHLGGALSIPLLTAIGQSVNVNQIDRKQMISAIEYLAKNDTGLCTQSTLDRENIEQPQCMGRP